MMTTLVIGLGSHHTGDDFGWQVCAQLQRKSGHLPGVKCLCDSNGLTWLEHLNQCGRLILVDSVLSDRHDASSHIVLDLNRETLPSQRNPVSNHQLPLQQQIDLARTLGRWPAQAFLLGWVAPAVPSTTMTTDIEQAVFRAVELLLTSLRTSAPLITSDGSAGTLGQLPPGFCHKM